MRKHFGIITKAFILSMVVLLAMSCKSDEKENPTVDVIAITIGGDLVTQQPEASFGTNEFVFYVLPDATQEDLKIFAPIIKVSKGCSLEPASGTVQDFNNGPVTYTVMHNKTNQKKSFTLKCIRNKYAGAQMLSFTFGGTPFVIADPAISTIKNSEDKYEMLFWASSDATNIDVASLAPVFTVSPGAVVSRVSGTAPGFAPGNVITTVPPIEYVVTSEDGVTQSTYAVSCNWKKIVYSFEDWNIKGTGATEHSYPTGWDSSNPGVGMIRLMYKAVYSGDFAMYSTTGYSGMGVMMTTLNTNGKAKGSFTPAIPKITSGTLFLGAFETDMSNTLKSTKFGKGNDVSYKPLSVKGYYKFTPGAEFHRSTVATPNATTVEPATTDKFVATAVLYEVTSPAEELYLYGTDLITSNRIVAMKQIKDSEAINVFTRFNLELNYVQPYDPNKFYRFTIVVSSSADGDSFSGAPGSTVIVDEIEVVYE